MVYTRNWKTGWKWIYNPELTGLCFFLKEILLCKKITLSSPPGKFKCSAHEWFSCPEGIIPNSGLTGPKIPIYIYIYIYIYIVLCYNCWLSLNHFVDLYRNKCNIIWRVLNIKDRAIIIIIIIINTYWIYIFNSGNLDCNPCEKLRYTYEFMFG